MGGGATAPAATLFAASQVGHRGFLSASRRGLAAGSEAQDPVSNYAEFSVSDYEEAKAVQDRLAENGVGTFWKEDIEESRQTDEQIRGANTEFISHFRERLKVTGNISAGAKIPGGYEWADGASELAGARQRGESRIWVDPEKIGAESIRFEGTGEEGTRAVARCEWVDPLASRIVQPDATKLGDLPPADADPFAIAMGMIDSPMTTHTQYAPGCIERLRAQVVRLGHLRTDEYLRRMHNPPADYRRDEWVSAETENQFRAWMSSEKNNRDPDGWKRLITSKLACVYTDTVHVLHDQLETLVFRQRNQTFLNVILERVAGSSVATSVSTPTTNLSRIVGHYYTYSLQLLARFSEPENAV